MTRSELIDRVAEKISGLTRKQVETIVETIFDGMKEALKKDDKIEIRGFGNFKTKIRQAKTARNPRTGERVEVRPKRTIHFKIGKPFYDALNPKSQ